MGIMQRIASCRIVGKGNIEGCSGHFYLNLSADSVMRGRVHAIRMLKGLVADLSFFSFSVAYFRLLIQFYSH